ncbi:hypothetical protein DK926_19705 [Rhodococcus sp. Eu-32]|uniref:hypothetical protein n=1 Tax=Rhodococcus sp. Eu-32 TaxID=1017319 RepID=UPI000DF46092|nr:hypothetical protein [Rhodococcus sp. Eu-32]RRQ26220.1 hypothetical protein DK926_19705 [Rhodococcus sp. Eu-32]
MLLDRVDDARLTRTLLGAHDLAAAVVVVHPTPGAAAAVTLAQDLLAALGHRLDPTGARGVTGPESAWRAVEAWICGDDIEHLIVLRSQLLTPDQRARLFQLHRDTGVHLVLVWHGLHRLPPHFDAAGMDLYVTDDLAAVTSRLGSMRRPHPPPSSPTRALTTVPDSAGHTFLADAARLLPPAEYLRVAGVYRQAFETTTHRMAAGRGAPDLPTQLLAWLPAPRTHLRARYGVANPGSARRWHAAVGLARFLGGLVVDSPGRADTVTRLRGAQAAFKRYGLELALPPHLNYMVGVGLTSIPVTEQLVARIRERIANPVRAAALATILFTGATYRELTYLPQDTVVGDTMVFRTTRVVAHPTDLGVWVIPASIRPLLRAATALPAFACRPRRTPPVRRRDRQHRRPAPARPPLRSDNSRSAPLAPRLAPQHRRTQPGRMLRMQRHGAEMTHPKCEILDELVCCCER